MAVFIFQALLDIEVSHKTSVCWLTFPMDVASDKSVREASVSVDKKLSAFDIEMAMNKDVFDRVCLFKDKCGLDGLSQEMKRWVEKKILDGKRNGEVK